MEQIEQRKEKAAELSSGRHANTDYAPKLTPYERKKQCSLCSVLVSWIEGMLSKVYMSILSVVLLLLFHFVHTLIFKRVLQSKLLYLPSLPVCSSFVGKHGNVPAFTDMFCISSALRCCSTALPSRRCSRKRQGEMHVS